MEIKQGDLVFVINSYGVADNDMEIFKQSGPTVAQANVKCKFFVKKTTGIVVGEEPTYVNYMSKHISFPYYKILMSTNEVVWIRQPEIQKNS